MHKIDEVNNLVGGSEKIPESFGNASTAKKCVQVNNSQLKAVFYDLRPPACPTSQIPLRLGRKRATRLYFLPLLSPSNFFLDDVQRIDDKLMTPLDFTFQ